MTDNETDGGPGSLHYQTETHTEHVPTPVKDQQLEFGTTTDNPDFDLDSDETAIREALEECCTAEITSARGPSTSPSSMRCVVLNDTPDVRPSLSHTVMFHVLLTSDGDCPKPYGRGNDLWDNSHVRLPCSPHSLYPADVECDAPTHRPRLQSRWSLICETLQRPFDSAGDFERAILTYNSRMRGRWDFGVWRHFVEHRLSESEAEHLLSDTLPLLARLALRLPELVRKPLPLLRQNCNHSVSLSQQQVACLLANAFFCTFPRRNVTRYARQQRDNQSAPVLPAINMNRLFGGTISERRIEKLKCLLHYFHRVVHRMPAGVLTYTRHYVSPSAAPDWPQCRDRSLSRIHALADGVIEQQPAHHLHVDFANCMVGGGVLGDGCVQEEIAFVQRPELIVACLLAERLSYGESVLVTGAEVFSATSGYADTFGWDGKVVDQQLRDRFGRRCWRMVAIDAADYSTVYNNSLLQFKPIEIRNQLLKAFSGFSVHPKWCGNPSTDREDLHGLPPVVTGNWGCGAFGGDRRLKALIQLMAASVAGRDVTYLTFGDHSLCRQLNKLQEIVDSCGTVTVATLFTLVLQFADIAASSESVARSNNVLQFVIDRLTQRNGAVREHVLVPDCSRNLHKQNPDVITALYNRAESPSEQPNGSSLNVDFLEHGATKLGSSSAVEQAIADKNIDSGKCKDTNEQDHVSESEDSASEMSQSHAKRPRSSDIRCYFQPR